MNPIAKFAIKGAVAIAALKGAYKIGKLAGATEVYKSNACCTNCCAKANTRHCTRKYASPRATCGAVFINSSRCLIVNQSCGDRNCIAL